MRLRDGIKSSLSSYYHVVTGLVCDMVQVFLHLKGILEERDFKYT